MKKIFLFILPYIARLHPKNRKSQDYPQLWYCWPKWTWRWNGLGYCNGVGENVKSRVNPIHRLKEFLCGVLTGHEISKTEWGYGGGLYVDRNCRWCDKNIKVPKYESPPPKILEDQVDELGFYK